MAIKDNVPVDPIGKIPLAAEYLTLKDEPGGDSVSPSNTVCKPTEKNYKNGCFTRFFVARYDSSKAVEVKEKWLKDNEKKLEEGLYTIQKVRWYLRDGYNKEKRKILHPITAEMLNRSNIDLASKNMPQLKATIKDYVKFFR